MLTPPDDLPGNPLRPWHRIEQWSMLSGMLDPLSLVPFALAALGGRVNDTDVAQHVAAGLTLLQRSASTVRALSGRRAAMLVPLGPLAITALAASDGRGALMLNPAHSPHRWAAQIHRANAGAVFTTSQWSSALPASIPHVLLDDAPRLAHVVHREERRQIDLGSHFALDLAGERDAEGSNDECLLSFADGEDNGDADGEKLAIASHREVLREARTLAERLSITPRDRVLLLNTSDSLLSQFASMIAPLLVGAAVQTPPVSPSARAAATKVIGDA